MALVLIPFAVFIFMWIVALAGLVTLVLIIFLKDFFYTEDSPSQTVRTTSVI